MKPQENSAAEEKELQLLLASNTLNFIEQDFPTQLDNKTRDPLKRKYELLINDLTKEIVRHKKARQEDNEIPQVKPDPLLQAKLEISKFQRDLLVKLHKEGDFSDAVLKKVEEEMDVDELKLNLQLPKEDKAL